MKPCRNEQTTYLHTNTSLHLSPAEKRTTNSPAVLLPEESSASSHYRQPYRSQRGQGRGRRTSPALSVPISHWLQKAGAKGTGYKEIATLSSKILGHRREALMKDNSIRKLITIPVHEFYVQNIYHTWPKYTTRLLLKAGKGQRNDFLHTNVF